MPTQKTPRITLTPQRLTWFLCAVAFALIALHILAQVILWAFSYDVQGFAGQLLSRFDLDAEISVPTWYNQMLLLLGAGLAGYIAAALFAAKKPHRYYWAGVAFALLFASIDEGASIHEMLGFLEIAGHLGLESSYFAFGWVIPGLMIVGALVLVFLRFWLQLPRRTQVLIATAVTMYLAGAIGIEMLSANYLASGGEWNSLLYRGLLVSIEESLEVFGIIVMIYALADFISTHKLRLDMRIAKK